jgi:hypothetical protein
MTAPKSTARPHNFKDLTGQTFGRWTVLGLGQPCGRSLEIIRWTCRCDCGKVRDVEGCGLRNGASLSCGCLRLERIAGLRKPPKMVKCLACPREFRVYPSSSRRYCSCTCARLQANGKRTHGASKTRLHEIWCHMKSRCQPGNSAAVYYADRGIAVCPEWAASFEAFRDWAMANGYRDDLEIDRADVNGGYSPDNCRWANRTQQMQNTRKRRDAKTSRFKGVSMHSQSRKWIAQIGSSGRTQYIGSFDSEEDAAKAYDARAREQFGEFAHTNFRD